MLTKFLDGTEATHVVTTRGARGPVVVHTATSMPAEPATREVLCLARFTNPLLNRPPIVVADSRVISTTMSPPAAPGDQSPLRAILFADTCGGRGSPFRTTAAAQSLPLHGSSILHYQLYALATTGVAEALVLSSTPLDLPPAIHAMSITTLSSSSWRSHGDALRDVESRQNLRPTHDFLLVQPGALFNLHAARLLQSHAARTAQDRNWLVSLVFRRGCSTSPLSVASQAASGALCVYKRGKDAAGAAVALDAAADNVGLLNGSGVCVSTDVVDVGLDICSPDFLLEFRENFDFDHVRDYVRAKLDGGEAELLGNRMHAHFLDETIGEFGTVVDGFGAHLLASRSVFEGWLSPIEPERVFAMHGGKWRRFGRGSLAFGSGGDVHETASVVDCTVVGSARIEAGAVVEGSVLEDGAVVGAGARVSHAVLCENATVEAGAKIGGGLLREGCVVSAEVALPRMCYLDTGVLVGPGGGAAAGLKQGSWVAREARKKRGADNGSSANGDDASDAGSDAESDSSDEDLGSMVLDGGNEYLGDGGEGVVLRPGRQSEYFLDRRTASGGGIGWPSFLDSVLSDSEDECEGTAGGGGEEVPQTETAGDEISNVDRFYDEMVGTVEHGVADNADVQTIALEVSSLRLSCEVLDSHAGVGVIRALAALVRRDNEGSSPRALMSAVKQVLQNWKELVDRFTVGDSEVAQRAMVDELSKFLAQDGRLLGYLLQTLYDIDVLAEGPILAWAGGEENTIAAGGDNLPFEEVRWFIEWLEEASEEE